MAAYEVKITPQADKELEDIAYYIALDSPQTSQHFITGLVATLANVLGCFPESGMIYKADIRKFSYKGYTAFYRVNAPKKQIEILHIVNLAKPLSARDINF